MHLTKPRSFLGSFAGTPTRTLYLLSILLCLTLAACFGSSESDEVAEAPTNTPVTVTQEEATPEEPTAAPTENAPDPTATSGSTEAASAQETAQRRVFQIDPAQSEARFIVDEVLFGNPNTVTGRTNEVSGQIEVDLNDPTQTTVGEIQINARTLATDNRFRNRSINRLILQSNRDEYQFITFTPTAIEGLPAEASAGDSFSFQVTGDLKIREVVQATTFDVTVSADSDTQVSGLAQAVVMREDFDLNIPNVEGVADVTEEVRLELDFVATASE